VRGCQQNLLWPDVCGKPVVQNELCVEHRDMTVKALLKQNKSLKAALVENERELVSFGIDKRTA
jgi:hypothetical protein